MPQKKEENKETVEQLKYPIPNYAQDILNKIKDPDRKLKYKITLARKMFLSQKKDKSGSNKFQNFDYFELKDIVPDAIEICCILGLEYDFVLGKRWGKLTVSDVESNASVVYPKERPQVKEGGNINQQLQGIGRTSTYLKRYCLMDFLEVVEADKVDAVDNSKKVVKKTAPKKTLNRKIMMDLDGVKYHMQSVLKDPSDMNEAQKELDKLKMDKKITQDTYNEMCKIIEVAK